MIAPTMVVGEVALAGWAWFECPHCNGLFVIGRAHQPGAVRGETRAARRHIDACEARS